MIFPSFNPLPALEALIELETQKLDRLQKEAKAMQARWEELNTADSGPIIDVETVPIPEILPTPTPRLS